LARIVPSVILFYFVTALLGAVIGLTWYGTLFGGGPVLILLAGALGSAGVLIYARFLGRLAWVISRLKPLKKKPAARPQKIAPSKPRNKKPRRARGVESTDPWAVPDAETLRESERASALPVEGYGMALDEPKSEPSSHTKPKKKKKEIEPAEPYDLSGEGPPPRPVVMPVDGNDPIGLADLPPEARTGDPGLDLARRLALTSKPQPIPTFPLFSGVYTFPWYPTSMKAWVFMTLGSMAVGGCLLGLIAISPF
jgi:hypothetical protein